MQASKSGEVVRVLIGGCLWALIGCGGSTTDPKPTSLGETKSESCLQQSCKAELNSCGSDCQKLMACLSECGSSESCVESCVSSSTETAAKQLMSVLECYDAHCKSTNNGTTNGGTTNGGTSSNSGTSTAAINQCIKGIAVVCACGSSAGSPCSSSEKNSYYNGCVSGSSYKGFDYFYCLGAKSPSSLNGCLSAFDSCESELPAK